mmetsp:Transcript_40516/g.114585  ORF Transcript_40516/g.114585 Transcript_40516/m.114585 type:complete len:250 (-) Transcript_40516:165-914(-)
MPSETQHRSVGASASRHESGRSSAASDGLPEFRAEGRSEQLPRDGPSWRHQLRQLPLPRAAHMEHDGSGACEVGDMLRTLLSDLGRFAPELPAGEEETHGDADTGATVAAAGGTPGQLAPTASAPQRTTLMVANIPPALNTEMLLQDWPIDGTWDFLYLPMSNGGKRSLGYAFINFLTEADAERFHAMWQSRRLSNCETDRTLQISTARVQGMQANVDLLKSKSEEELRSRRCRPIIIIDGRLVSFEQV